MPAAIWMFGLFILGTIALFGYGKSGPKPMPSPTNLWSTVEVIKNEVMERERSLVVKDQHKEEMPLYEVKIERLEDLQIPQQVARYVIRMRPTQTLNHPDRWAEGGMDVAFLDHRSDERRGELQLVAIRRLKRPKPL